MQKLNCFLFIILLANILKIVKAQQEHVIDDFSDVIDYSPAGAWNHYTGTENSTWFLNTSSSTNSQNAYAQFTFTGISFEWYGGFGTDKSNATVEIDGQNNTVQLYANPGTSNTLIWQIHNLTNEEHTVRIIQPNPRSSTSNVAVDRFIYETDNNGSITDSTVTEGGETGSSTPTATNGEDNDNDDSGGGGSQTGAIVGGVIGGLAGLSIIGLAAWYLLRRRLAAKQDKVTVIDEDLEMYAPIPTSTVNPFTTHTTSSMDATSEFQSSSHHVEHAPSYEESQNFSR